LDEDFARLHPDARLSLVGASLFVLLAFACLAGGVLAEVGRGRRFTYGGFLVSGARLLGRNLRVLVIGAVLGLLLFWGVDLLDRWIVEHGVYEWDTGPLPVIGARGPWLSLELWLDALRWLWGFLFLVLVLAAKMAMARLAVLDRRSALLAWVAALGTVLRHPLRVVLLLGGWLVCWLGVSYLIGEITVYLIEGKRQVWLGLAMGQLAILWTQVVLVALLLAARGLALPEPYPAPVAEPVLNEGSASRGWRPPSTPEPEVRMP
jgi:hypothetical protein